jgi:hypothetical protein
MTRLLSPAARQAVTLLLLLVKDSSGNMIRLHCWPRL